MKKQNRIVSSYPKVNSLNSSMASGSNMKESFRLYPNKDIHESYSNRRLLKEGMKKIKITTAVNSIRSVSSKVTFKETKVKTLPNKYTIHLNKLNRSFDDKNKRQESSNSKYRYDTRKTDGNFYNRLNIDSYMAKNSKVQTLTEHLVAMAEILENKNKDFSYNTSFNSHHKGNENKNISNDRIISLLKKNALVDYVNVPFPNMNINYNEETSKDYSQMKFNNTESVSSKIFKDMETARNFSNAKQNSEINSNTESFKSVTGSNGFKINAIEDNNKTNNFNSTIFSNNNYINKNTSHINKGEDTKNYINSINSNNINNSSNNNNSYYHKTISENKLSENNNTDRIRQTKYRYSKITSSNNSLNNNNNNNHSLKSNEPINNMNVEYLLCNLNNKDLNFGRVLKVLLNENFMLKVQNDLKDKEIDSLKELNTVMQKKSNKLLLRIEDLNKEIEYKNKQVEFTKSLTTSPSHSSFISGIDQICKATYFLSKELNMNGVDFIYKNSTDTKTKSNSSVKNDEQVYLNSTKTANFVYYNNNAVNKNLYNFNDKGNNEGGNLKIFSDNVAGNEIANNSGNIVTNTVTSNKSLNTRSNLVYEYTDNQIPAKSWESKNNNRTDRLNNTLIKNLSKINQKFAY